MDYLGPVPIPDPPLVEDFPLRIDYGASQEVPDRVIPHLMDQPGLKIEHRIFTGPGSRRFRVSKQRGLACNEYNDLKAHWTSAYGIYAEFYYSHPIKRGEFERVRVRYAEPQITFDHLVGLITNDPGIVLAEVPETSPVLDVTSVSERFPDTGMADQLLNQEQFITPLVTIRPRDAGAAPLYLSDRRVALNMPAAPQQQFLARLIEWRGISQSMGENSDSAQFSFGNADEVWYEYVKQVDLTRAAVEFSLFAMNSPTDTGGRRLNLWKGYLQSSEFRDNGSFDISGSDGTYEMNLAYPTRQISRTCWKRFADGVWCPYSGPETFCAKSWQDCSARGMTRHFGGMVVNSQGVRIKHGSTGVDGYGRSGITSVTVKSDSIYERPLQEVYTDTAIPVTCDVAGGRDEDEFYSALGIVGEGPIGAYDKDLMKHLLDQQPCHDPKKSGGWRGVLGNDPVEPSYDFFQISQSPWNQVPPNSTYTAGTAFAEIRRTDAKGLQLSKISDREMTVTVTQGMGGWTWSGPGSRTWAPYLTNPVWVMVNVYLKALGLKADPQHAGLITAAEQEKHFDVAEAVTCAGLCDQIVTSLINPAVSEKQYTFRAVLKEQKPLREWLQEIANTFLGYYTFAAGKLRIGMKYNSSVPAGGAFSRANFLHRSLRFVPVQPKFNYLTVQFGDEEFNWELNSVNTYDIDHAKFLGTEAAPMFTRSKMSFVGVSGKSQAMRLCATRLKEEIGGATRREQQDARNVSLRTTILALAIYPGQISSVDHPRLPNGRVEFRVERWTLNPDWSIDIEGTSTCDSMYDLTIGPKPADVPADPFPAETFPAPQGMAWLPNEEAPVAGDPLYGLTERTFALWQDYAIEAEGTYSPSLVVRGERPLNRFLAKNASVIRGINYSTSGGTLAGGQTYYFQVGQRDAKNFAPLSNIAAIWVPPGTNTNSVTLAPISKTENLPGYSLWMGLDIRRLTQQTNELATALPTSITITDYAKRRQRGAPNAAARRLRIKAKEVEHAGVAGLQVQQVIAPNQIVSSEFIGSTDNWVGQILSVIADASDGGVPLWNFTITAFAASTGTLTVSPDCVRGTPEDSVEEDDVMIVRSRATSATTTTITNTLWNNSIAEVQWGAVDGLIPGDEVELLVRIIAGTGAGQLRRCIANDNVTHTVDPAWETIPDTTSIYIVEYPDWIHEAESSALKVELEDQDIEIGGRVDNLTGNVVLIGGFLIDDQEIETFAEFAVYRDIYLFGEPYHVRTTIGTAGSLEGVVADQTIRIDTGTGPKIFTLPQSGRYFGRTMLIVNDGTNAATVRPYAGDELHSGASEIVLENFGDWVLVTAGGDGDVTTAVNRRRVVNWRGRRYHPVRGGSRKRRRHLRLPD